MAACRRYLEYAPRDFITFEYCMLDGINDNMTTNTAQYDPTWDLKMMEGLKDDDDNDDEMSSDNVGFFDL